MHKKVRRPLRQMEQFVRPSSPFSSSKDISSRSMNAESPLITKISDEYVTLSTIMLAETVASSTPDISIDPADIVLSDIFVVNSSLISMESYVVRAVLPSGWP